MTAIGGGGVGQGRGCFSVSTTTGGIFVIWTVGPIIIHSGIARRVGGRILGHTATVVVIVSGSLHNVLLVAGAVKRGIRRSSTKRFVENYGTATRRRGGGFVKR